MGPLIAMFWNPGDVSSGLQSQSGQPYSQLAGGLCDHHTSCRSIELTLGINGPLEKVSLGGSLGRESTKAREQCSYHFHCL